MCHCLLDCRYIFGKYKELLHTAATGFQVLEVFKKSEK
jgi:hypothetical protein